jgi:hypothetical protein
MPHNWGTRRKPNWAGYASYKGRRKWVSGCASVAEYEKELARARAELRERVKRPFVPTCMEFAGASIRPDGRVMMSWPEGQRARKREGRRDSDPTAPTVVTG